MDPQQLQPQPENLQTSSESVKTGKRTHIIVGVTGFLIVLLLIVFFIQNKEAKKIQPSQSQSTVRSVPSLTPNQSLQNDENLALVAYIPNFNSLQMSNFPNFTDVRGVYPYEKNIILTGRNAIAEYDPAKDQVVRTLNTRIIKSVFSTAIIGNNLYVVSVPELVTTGQWTDSTPVIYKLDLVTGKVTTAYFGKQDLDPTTKLPKLTNLYITSKGKYLYASSYEGVMRIDTETKTIYTYPEAKVGFPGTCVTHIATKNDQVVGLINCQSRLGIIELDEQTDTWKYRDAPSEEFSSYINKRLTDVHYPLPTYTYKTLLTNNKYYIFADKGVYLLEENKMPVFYKPIIVDQLFDIEKNRSKMYLTKDERYIALFGPVICGPGPACPVVDIIGVDLQTNKVVGLLQKNTDYQKMTDTEKQNLAEKIAVASVTEENDVVTLLPSQSNTPFAKIDLNTMTVTLSL